MVPNDQQTIDDETGQRIKFDDDDDDDADHTNNDVDILTFMDQQQEEDDNDNDLIHLPLQFLWQQEDERKLLLRNNYNERSMIRRRRRRVATESLVEGEEELLIEDDEDQSTILTDSDGNNSNNINKRRPRKLQEITGVATQYVNFFIGTPAQKRTLAISTGADFTAFPCQECTECGPTIPFYYQSLSSTYTTIPCGECAVGQSNAGTCNEARTQCNVEGGSLADDYSSWNAYEARDYVYVGGSDNEISKLGLGADLTGSTVPQQFGFPLTFACQTKATGSFAAQVEDGISGFSTAPTSFVNQMVDHGKLKRRVFALCCGRPEVVGNELKGAGVLTLGGYDPRSPDLPMAYFQNVEESPGNMYKVYINNVYLRAGGGRSVIPSKDDQKPIRLDIDIEKLNKQNGGTILDSGVPILIFDESIRDTFLLEWKKIVGSDFTLGDMFFFTEDDARRLPTVVVQIKAPDGVDNSFDPRTVPNMAGDLDPSNPYDALMVIPAANYLEYNPGTGSYRVKIDIDSTEGSFIGMSAMQGHIFVYDVEQKRIGFSESSNCSPWDPNSAALVTDDDMYTIVSSAKGNGDTAFDGGFPVGGGHGDSWYGYGSGTCISATCISFVTVGYCIVIIVLAVAFKKYRPRDRSKQFDREIYSDNETHETNSILFDPDRSVGSGRSSMKRFDLRSF